ncbi:unnamed protein product, partial [Polarella glacialis]
VGEEETQDGAGSRSGSPSWLSFSNGLPLSAEELSKIGGGGFRSPQRRKTACQAALVEEDELEETGDDGAYYSEPEALVSRAWSETRLDLPRADTVRDFSEKAGVIISRSSTPLAVSATQAVVNPPARGRGVLPRAVIPEERRTASSSSSVRLKSRPASEPVLLDLDASGEKALARVLETSAAASAAAAAATVSALAAAASVREG